MQKYKGELNRVVRIASKMIVFTLALLICIFFLNLRILALVLLAVSSQPALLLFAYYYTHSAIKTL